MDNYNKVLKIVIEETGCESLKENEDIDLIANDIIDSLAFINLIDSLSLEFNIDIQPTQVTAESWRTVKGIANMVEELIAQNKE